MLRNKNSTDFRIDDEMTIPIKFLNELGNSIRIPLRLLVFVAGLQNSPFDFVIDSVLFGKNECMYEIQQMWKAGLGQPRNLIHIN